MSIFLVDFSLVFLVVSSNSLRVSSLFPRFPLLCLRKSRPWPKFRRFLFKTSSVMISLGWLFVFFPPGSTNLHFLTPDSDSSSKTLYFASWTGLDSRILVKNDEKSVKLIKNTICLSFGTYGK